MSRDDLIREMGYIVEYLNTEALRTEYRRRITEGLISGLTYAGRDHTLDFQNGQRETCACAIGTLAIIVPDVPLVSPQNRWFWLSDNFFPKHPWQQTENIEFLAGNIAVGSLPENNFCSNILLQLFDYVCERMPLNG